MHYSKTVYRPAFERDAALLQVTAGCSYNRCAFCSMYQNTPFRVSPMEEIVEDLRELRAERDHIERVFLVNGDPMVLRTERLLQIAEEIHKILPECQSIGCFCAIPNFYDKTVEDLKALKEAGFSDLNIGVESGLDSVLDLLGKGYHAKDAYAQLTKLNQAGLPFSLNLILGAQGNGQFHELATANANLLNTVQPSLFFTTTLYAFPGTRLYDILYGGALFRGSLFTENTMALLITEEHDLLSQLELTDTRFFGRHPSNPIPLDGHLPEDREFLLSTLEKSLRVFPRELLCAPPSRGAEGGVLYPEFFTTRPLHPEPGTGSV